MTTYPLGRIVQHDPRSRAFGVTTAAQLRTVTHRHHGPVLDQGNLGSCTGNALAQALNTTPLYRGHLQTEDDAVQIYGLATHLDGAPGVYPPDDTGSSGLAVCKAAQRLGKISSYRHAFGLTEALAALVDQPVIVGTSWHEAMFHPDSHGFVRPTGGVAGGHEWLLLGLDIVGKYVTALNSWGASWGLKGRFHLTFDDLGALLADQGDVTVPSL